MSPSRRMLMSLRDSDASVRGSLESDLPCRRLDKAMESRVLLYPPTHPMENYPTHGLPRTRFRYKTVRAAYG